MSILGVKEMNWLITFLILGILFYKFWIVPSRLMYLKSNLVKNLSQQFSIALKTKKDGTSSFFVAMFFLFVLTNFMGLFPNVFTSSSHITFNSIVSFSMWTGFFLFGWMTYTNKMLAHLVPLSTPKPLISFMVLIEMISTMIRPGTLGIRLMANMVSGHLLLTLMGNSMCLTPIFMLLILVLAQSILTLLEMGVSVIQGYVFCMLLSLYSDDSDYQS
uniref:ATP synthase subunit a n=1 Tax=Pseudodendrothrips mori TaxID=1291231 RepID=A0A7M3T298_9NEOP|nr:ATP synthase F0 subunit 6 [Pseudodendrothrips mori]QFO91092.1 ATP synthase F0 subunit 6 [Pseudodendrothrips mori]